jgi:hypothetical protein
MQRDVYALRYAGLQNAKQMNLNEFGLHGVK